MADKDVVIRISAKNLTKAEFTKVRKQLRELEKKAGLTSKRFVDLGGSFKTGALQAIGFGSAVGISAIAVGKLIGSLASGVRGFVSFEKSMLRIETLVGVAREEVEAMKKSVRGIAAATGRAPQELAEAMFQIASAGLRGDDALIALEASARGAALGLGETKDVADAATSIVNAYGVENINAAEAVDVLISTVKLGKASADEFATSIGTVIPIASAAGVSIQEVGTAMAILTRSGASASESATQVAGIIRAIIKPSEQASKALGSIGLSMDDVRESIREQGLLETMQDLRTQLDPEQLAKFAGRAEALNAVLGLTGDKFKQTADAAREMEEAFGLAQEGMARLQEDASFRAELLSAAFTNMVDAIGEGAVNFVLSTAAGQALRESLERTADEAARLDKESKFTADSLNILGLSFEQVSGQGEQTTAAIGEIVAQFSRATTSFNQLDAATRNFIPGQKTAVELFWEEVAATKAATEGRMDHAEAMLQAAFELDRLNFEARIQKELLQQGGSQITIFRGDLEDLETATDSAAEAQRQYNEALAAASDISQILGGNLGRLVGQTLAAAAALESLGAAGGLGGLKDAFKTDADDLDIFGGLGTAAGLLGPLIGLGKSLVEGIAGLFGRDAQDVARDVGRDIGAQISEGLAEQILKSGQNIQFFLREIFAEGGLGIDRLAEEVGDLFSLFERGEISEPELIRELKESIPILIAQFQELGPAGEEQIQRIIAAAERFGIELDEINQLMQATFAPATMEEIAAQFDITNDQVRELADRLGIDVQTNLERNAAELGLTVEQYKKIGKAIEEEYGIPLDQVDELLASMGISAEDLAKALGIDLGDLPTQTESAADETKRAADEAKRYADEIERAGRALGNITFPGFPNVGGIGMQHGGFGEVTRPTPFIAGEAGREGFAFFPGGLPQATPQVTVELSMPVTITMSSAGSPGITDKQVSTLIRRLQNNQRGAADELADTIKDRLK